MESAAYWWSMLGRDPGELVEIRTLTAGASGSAVYRLHVNRFGRGDFVLKVAADERTRRELYFYRDLAAHVPVGLPKLVAGIERDDGTCLLFEASGVPLKNPDRWSDLAEQLGALHNDRVAAAAVGWPWAKPEMPAEEPDVVVAAKIWKSLGCDSLPANVWARFDRPPRQRVHRRSGWRTTASPRHCLMDPREKHARLRGRPGW
ncbi:MAG TPA: phosphotransferase [Candidatus Limnocylindrales bacterium]|nr:phosphotransferase [Candidatus Limnocylindrales bacterium]